MKVTSTREYYGNTNKRLLDNDSLPYHPHQLSIISRGQGHKIPDILFLEINERN